VRNSRAIWHKFSPNAPDHVDAAEYFLSQWLQ
jgi:hypothetical protein